MNKGKFLLQMEEKIAQSTTFSFSNLCLECHNKFPFSKKIHIPQCLENPQNISLLYGANWWNTNATFFEFSNHLERIEWLSGTFWIPNKSLLPYFLLKTKYSKGSPIACPFASHCSDLMVNFCGIRDKREWSLANGQVNLSWKWLLIIPTHLPL